MTALKLNEHQIQTQFFDILRANEKRYPQLRFFHAIPNASGIGGKSGQIIGAKFKREGRRAGIFDTFFPYFTGDFHGLYIEFKVKGRKESPEQKAFADYVRNEDFKAVVCFSADEALNELESYTGWKLSR